MLTPLDIQNKEFAKGFRGYIEIEVDSFLDEVIADFEYVFKENLELKSKIDMLNEQVGHYSTMENTLQKTLIVAQTTAEDVIKTARQQGDAIINESDRRAEKIMDSARDQVINSKKEYETMRKEILMFRTKYKSLLNSQLETIDHYGADDNVFSILEEMKEKDIEKRESVFQSEKVAQSEMEQQMEQQMEQKVQQPMMKQPIEQVKEMEPKEESIFASEFEEQENEYVSNEYVPNFESDEDKYSQSLEEQVEAFSKDIEEQKHEQIASLQAEKDMYCEQPVASYQGADNMYESTQNIQDEPASYQGADDMYAESLQSKESTFAESFENDSPATYQGEDNMYAGSLQEKSQLLTENQEVPGNAFANKLQRQRDQESLYVENLQQGQKINKNKITPKDNAYEEEIQNIYTSMEPKNAVLD